ncbi:MAG TPA: ABC transporter substrate-binding protein [Candidatus Pullichristensenella stercoripullorum]|nr:ABC transporter substrate-binding protein [Candidatus Pullichristensenella stercoripullorum]
MRPRSRATLLLAAFLALALLLPLGGCAPRSAPEDTAGDGGEDTVLLGFSQLGRESAWRMGNSRDIQEAAERAGVQLMYDNAQQEQENQIKAIRSFIAYQVDVIAFAPIVEQGWDTVLTEARDAGIPVLLTDRFIVTEDPSLYVGYVGADFLAEGRKAGAFLVEKADREGLEDLKIVELSGTLSSTPMQQRSSGFREMIAGDARFEILETVSGDFLRSKGKECMIALLERHERIDVLFSHNDSMTLGAIEAIEEAGLRPGEDIIIITVDGEQAAIDLLQEGKINCVVECTPMLGDIIMDLTKKLAAGEEIPRVTHPEEDVFCEFDADLMDIPPRGY